jgi:pimeloyl-ACP methyl ester carboxylesterase
MRPVRDIVVLVPGFLGFDALGSFAYFAQGIATAIRVTLEERKKLEPSELVVVPCNTVPGGSLAERQGYLRKELAEIVRYYGRHTPPGELRVHLFGHSTGGLDAELLTYERPLSGPAWSEEDRALRGALRSVVTIGAPLAGTHLADSALARLLTTGRGRAASDDVSWWSADTLREGPRQLAETLFAGSRLVGSDLLVGEVLQGALFDGRMLGRFLRSLLLNRQLLGDLRPAFIRELVTANRPDDSLAELHRARFVTVARNSAKPLPSAQLFEALHRLTAQNVSASDHADAVLHALDDGLRSREIPVLGAVMAPSPLTPAANDGIVNSALQLSHWDMQRRTGDKPTRIAALVVADHVDVLGYFPSSARSHRDRANGFLTSGSEFREAEFSQLCRAIAGEIASGISPSSLKRLSASSGEARQIVLRKASDSVRPGADPRERS